MLSVEIGIDLVEVGKVRKVFERRRSFQETIFTPEELRYSWERRNPYTHLAACFAVKEAFFKALGTGLSGEVDWREVEVQREPSGRPVFHLCGETLRVARDMGVVGYKFSVAHAGEYAVAVVAIEMGE